jgi:hypothetical protein
MPRRITASASSAVEFLLGMLLWGSLALLLLAGGPASALWGLAALPVVLVVHEAAHALVGIAVARPPALIQVFGAS